jgi:hypothetical protein
MQELAQTIKDHADGFSNYCRLAEDESHKRQNIDLNHFSTKIASTKDPLSALVN